MMKTATVEKRNNLQIKMMALLLMTVMALQLQAQEKLTLQKSIEIAFANNNPTKQTELLAKTAELNYKQAKYNRLPLVSGNYDYGLNNGRSINPFTNGYINQQLTASSANAQAVLPIFSGFQLKNLIKQNELSFATATMEWQQKKDELTLQVILAYLQILSNEDALALAKQQAYLTKEQVDRLDIMAVEGATPPGNVSDLKGQYAGDELSIITAENSLESSIVDLTTLMNVPYDSTMTLDRTGLVEAIEPYNVLPADIYNTALQTLASVKASELKVKASTAAVKVANGAFSPTVSLYGALSTNYSSVATLNNLVGFTDVPTGDYVTVGGANVPVITKQGNYTSQKIAYGSQFSNNLSSGYGVSVSIPLFNRLKTRTNVKLAKNDERYNKLIADNIKFTLKQAVDQAYINITTTYKRYQALNEQVEAYTESFRIATIRFENGAITSPDYLIAKNNMERAKANLVTTKYEYLLRKKVLDFYMGTLK